MEIHNLKISITEQDVNEAIRRHLPKDQPIEDLGVQLTADGIHIRGVYPFFVNVSFESLWRLAVAEGKVLVELASLRALGMPGNIFRSAILKLIGDVSRKQQGLTVEDERIVLDPDRMLAQHGLSARSNVRAITCQAGVLIVEAGT